VVHDTRGEHFYEFVEKVVDEVIDGVDMMLMLARRRRRRRGRMLCGSRFLNGYP
jgi:hypothetical protein